MSRWRFEPALDRARVAAYAPGEFVGQEGFMTAAEISALAARAGIGPGVAVLDVCCGTGGPGRLVTGQLGCAYLGVDESTLAVSLARERTNGLPCRFAVAQVPPLPAGSFDVVLLLEAMLAFEDKDALVRGIAGALRPSGRFAFTLEAGPPLTAAERAAMPAAGTVWPAPLDDVAACLGRAGLVVTWQEDRSAAHAAVAQALAGSFAAHAEDLAGQLGRPRLDYLLATHRLWIEWLREGRVRKLALVAERASTRQISRSEILRRGWIGPAPTCSDRPSDPPATRGRSMRTQRQLLVLAAVLLGMAVTASPASGGGLDRTRLVTGLEGGAGSTVGPDGALYVTENIAGRISRIDPRSGRVTTFAEGLPARVIGNGGAMDVAFLGRTAYAIVSLVGPDVGGSATVGLYRVDGRHRFTVVADIGAFAVANPPTTPFDVASGLQYAMEPYHGGFLITDGHHNRVLYVTRHGDISVVEQFDNIVPTGLESWGPWVFMAEAGPVPHVPADGKVVALRRSGPAAEIASGAPLLVDVELGRHGLYALSQGAFPPMGTPGSPASPNTGSLVKVRRHGSLKTVAGGLDRPTSLEFIGRSAYVVTLTGEVWRLGAHG